MSLKTEHGRRLLRPSRRVGSLLTAAALGTAIGAAGLAAPALAVDPTQCSKGLNTATTAWGTCTGGGQWRVVTWCYATGSTNSGWWSWPSGTHTQYSSCPSWSHVTNVIIEAR
ncbi:hypothetical protein MRQ36_29165 [Micromonospora sp. R77]|uniref:hypothetical protein n=1 Tax=Micromonospora sp. R77 TaxID=2925836 RepID=UPI001F607B34|nr:hypothetical protein [Micromonospora sp. R77]MCI4066406.1 hypothetical protein [Micromonospora sp. R77]